MASGRAFASLTKGNSVKGLKKKHPGIERFEGKQESPGFHYFMTTNGRLGPTGSFMVWGPPKAGVSFEGFQSKSQDKTLLV